MPDMLLVADLLLKDNRGVLNNCIICETGRKGSMSIQDEVKMKTIIEREHELFFFQNRCANGHTHINNLDGYNIHQVPKKDF